MLVSLVLMSLRNRLYNLEEFRKVCVHGSGKDSGGKGTITNIFCSVTFLHAGTNNGKLLIHSKK